MGLIPGIADRLKGRCGVWCGRSDLLIRGWQALARRFHTPDLPGILGNGAVTGKLARGGYVPDHHSCPLSWVLKTGRESLGSLCWCVAPILFHPSQNQTKPYQPLAPSPWSPAPHLVQLTDFVLAFNVFLVICKDFKPGGEWRNQSSVRLRAKSLVQQLE